MPHALRRCFQARGTTCRAFYLISFLTCFAIVTSPTLDAQDLPLAQPPHLGIPLGETARLDWEGDIAAKLVDDVDRFLLRNIEASVDARQRFWKRDTSSPAAYVESIKPRRERFRFLVGARDSVVQDSRLQVILPPNPNRKRLGAGDGFEVFEVQWAAFGQVQGRGLLLRPTSHPIANVVAVPDCEQTPEQVVGLEPGVARDQQFARRLASAGCNVVVPVLINRNMGEFDWGPRGTPQITNREMLYRSAFELGRGLIAYEVQTISAAGQALRASSQQDDLPLGIIGWGEGGLLAMYAAALSPKFDVTCVSGYFGSRQSVWQEPIDRNIVGLLREFGDAEIATLIAPRSLIIENSNGPESEFHGNGGGAPARLTSPTSREVTAEVNRAHQLTDGLDPFMTVADLSQPHTGADAQAADSVTSNGHLQTRTLITFLERLGVSGSVESTRRATYTHSDYRVDTQQRHRRQMQELDAHTQELLRDSAATRTFFDEVDTQDVSAYEASIEPHRTRFYDQVIGRWNLPLAKPKPRTRLSYETESWRGYEVVLDVFDEVFAYGILLVPKNLNPGERRPVVVCQHGLEGRPQDTIGKPGSQYYASFASQLADRGYVTFAPQNLYIGGDRFRTLQRKSYPLQKTLFSIIVPQHQQIVDWIQTLPFVEPDRVAFYGLSYGGKTAMRVPPLVTDYCLSICSADFNEWVDKNASTRNPRSYVWTGEYEIFEFDLGSTFNYAEMAGLIAPRPFMVERGHADGVADDWTVAWEFAKVRHLYAARLKIPERCEIEWFDGPHRINGEATFRFLDRHLKGDSD